MPAGRGYPLPLAREPPHGQPPPAAAACLHGNRSLNPGRPPTLPRGPEAASNPALPGIFRITRGRSSSSGGESRGLL